MRRILLLTLLSSLLCVPAFAGHIVVPARTPSIITSPDYADTFQTPNTHSGQVFTSDEGYLFSYDSFQRRMYHMPYSYALEKDGRIIPVEMAGAAPIPMFPQTVIIDGMFVTK